jgi:mRNA-degrading endonuclease toxin of MazEF toxin-antitoxin module
MVNRTGCLGSDTVTTIPKHVLTRRIAQLEPPKVAAVDRALRFALGLI